MGVVSSVRRLHKQGAAQTAGQKSRRVPQPVYIRRNGSAHAGETGSVHVQDILDDVRSRHSAHQLQNPTTFSHRTDASEGRKRYNNWCLGGDGNIHVLWSATR